MSLPFYAYILRCADGSYYTGHSDGLEERFAKHQAGIDPGAYTALRRPFASSGHKSSQLERKP